MPFSKVESSQCGRDWDLHYLEMCLFQVYYELVYYIKSCIAITLTPKLPGEIKLYKQNGHIIRFLSIGIADNITNGIIVA